MENLHNDGTITVPPPSRIPQPWVAAQQKEMDPPQGGAASHFVSASKPAAAGAEYWFTLQVEIPWGPLDSDCKRCRVILFHMPALI